VYFLKKQMVSLNNSILPDIICLLAISGFLTLHSRINIPINDIFVFIIPIVYGFMKFDEKWYVNLFWNVVIALIFLAVTNLVMSLYLGIFNVSLSQILTETSARLAFAFSGNLFLLIIVILVTSFSERKNILSWSTIGLLVLLNIICLVSLELVFTIGLSGTVDLSFTGICICLFLISLLSISLYEVLVDNAKKRQRLKVDLEHKNLTLKHIDELHSLYTEMSNFRHDFKHQMQIVNQMITCQNIKGVQQFVTTMNEKVSEYNTYVTGNESVDALLTVKASMMRKQNIMFEYHPYPLDELPLDDSQFCSLVGNLLDNAIESVERITASAKTPITLSFARTWDMFYISCQNPYNPSTVRQKHGKLLSSKDGVDHGIGIRSIETIITQASGDIQYKKTEEVFQVDISIPYEEKRRRY
jgi:hypothetical protein